MSCSPISGCRGVWVGTAALLCGIAAQPRPVSALQQEPAPRIVSVECLGLEQQSTSYVQGVVRVQAGDALDRPALDLAVSRLLRTGRFLSATYRVDEVEDGVRVVFELNERPILAAVRFAGNSKFSDSQLRKALTVKVGDTLDRFSVREGQEAIRTMYRDAGYGEVSVTFDAELLDRTGELVYRIEEGLRTRIRKILFEGNDTLTDRELKRRMETKTKFWVFRSGAFDVDVVERDAIRLQSHYRDQGFLDARVGYRRDVGAKGDITIVFTVAEGTRYRIEDIRFSGLTVFSPEALLEMMTSRVGEVIKPPSVDRDVNTIRTRYGELGYIYVEVRATRVFSDTPGLVHLAIDVSEGEAYRVGRVIVRGNAQTKDKVVRRALDLYPPDDAFNMTAARDAEQNLLATRIFSAAQVLPVGDEPGVRDAVIDVQEADRTGDFLFGFGVTSNSGLIGNVVLDLKNFDLFDSPRSLTELIKLESFQGGGQHFRLEVQPGTDLSRFRMDFTEPYLMDKPVRFDVGLYVFDRGREGYTERRAGMSVSLGTRFRRGRLQGWSTELALRLENAGMGDLDIFAARDIRDDEGSNLMTSVKITFVRDRTDNRFVPTRGDRIRIGYEQFGLFGGEYDFGRLTLGYTWYTTLRTDRQDRRSVLRLKAEGGAILGDAPVFERYYAGGTGSLRGFEFRGVGPRQGLQNNNIGGDYLLLLSGEYSFPLYGDNVRGLVFLDSGAVGTGTYRAAVGVGLRLTINIFGPLPVEVALAFPFLSDSDDDTQLFSFSFGGLF